MPGPNWISQAELDSIRQQQIDLIAEIGDFCTLYRATYTSDGQGGQTRTLAVVGNNVPLRHWISSGSNGTSEEVKFWGEQEVSQTDAFVVMYWNQDVQINDVILYKGREWRVVGLQFDDAFITAKRLRVESMRP